MFISNSCILPSGWDVESLLQPHRSVPFNPAIANAFYRAGYIETWGRGIQKIYDSCKALGVPAPEYSIVGEDITVKFTAHDTIFSDTVNDTVNSNDRENDTINNTVNGNDGENDTKHDTKHDTNHETKRDTNQTLSDVERNIYEAIIDNPEITKPQLVSILEISKATVSRATKKLKELGYIERIGTNRTGYWKIIK